MSELEFEYISEKYRKWLELKEMKIALFLVCIWACCVIVFLWAADNTLAGAFLTAAGTVLVIGYSFMLSTLSVPAAHGAIALNIFTGKETPYPPGVGFKWPWERVTENDYFDLYEYTEKSTCLSAAKDGPNMEIGYSVQWRPSVELLPQYRKMLHGDREAIRVGLVNRASNIIDQKIARRKADNMRGQTGKLEEHVVSVFEESKDGEGMGDLERAFGVDILRIQIASIDYDERTQRARETKNISERFREETAKIVEGSEGKISSKDARNSLLIIDGKVTKHITEVEGNPKDGFVMALAEAVGGKHGKTEESKR